MKYKKTLYIFIYSFIYLHVFIYLFILLSDVCVSYVCCLCLCAVIVFYYHINAMLIDKYKLQVY